MSGRFRSSTSTPFPVSSLFTMLVRRCLTNRIPTVFILMMPATPAWLRPSCSSYLHCLASSRSIISSCKKRHMLTKEFRAEHTEIPWEQMIGLRHVLVHGYYKIKPKQLWNIIEKDIPILMPQKNKQLLDSKELTKRISKSKAWQ